MWRMYVLPTPSPHGCFESRFSYHRPQCFFIDNYPGTDLATSLSSCFNFPQLCSKAPLNPTSAGQWNQTLSSLVETAVLSNCPSGYHPEVVSGTEVALRWEKSSRLLKGPRRMPWDVPANRNFLLHEQGTDKSPPFRYQSVCFSQRTHTSQYWKEELALPLRHS